MATTRLDEIECCLRKGDLEDLFLRVLLWGRPDHPPQDRPVGAPVSQDVRFTPLAQMGDLPVFRVDWHKDKPPTIAERRAVLRALHQTYREHLLVYVTRNERELLFVWPRTVGEVGEDRTARVELRTLPYTRGEPARTTVERLALLAFSLDEVGSVPTVQVLDRLDRAFDVEAVTKSFFEDYKHVFFDLQSDLAKQSGDAQWAHDYALQLLNRLMFLYFVQRKGWLGNRTDFLRHLWFSYRRAERPADTFYSQWLSPLFFEAFNNRFQAGRADLAYLPADIRRALQTAPYLNGGLFARNLLDEAHPVHLADEFFASLVGRPGDPMPGLLERYNFTISESTPLDVEVAVDPEMIGRVYESLVNVTSTEGETAVDARLNAGIFYTPRVEIDLMCRLALVDCLANHLGQNQKPLLYEAVFAQDPEEKEAADRELSRGNLWPALDRALTNLTVCDPACGSGSFLVGMLLVLDDLQTRADRVLGRNRTHYERRHDIIRESLYGVDAMDWAVHVAELRLWLQLVIETEVRGPELRFKPLLPSLSFKVRPGDSLVQEVGGVNLNLHRDTAQMDIPASLKGRLTRLTGMKRGFYNGEGSHTEDSIRQEERRLFVDILEERRSKLESARKRLFSRLADQKITLTGDRLAAVDGDERRRLGAELQEAEAALASVSQARTALAGDPKRVPFVWDLAFPEVFGGEERGFDIVVGNPPYVRQERIAPPDQPDAPASVRKQYKDKLQLSVWSAYPRFFGYDPRKQVGRGNPRRKLDGKSDLYVYFYFHALSLLNPKGSFCFITSNSWLDVGYGADLQEFLLRHGQVKQVWDNQARRSFSQADVNTVIALLGPADDRQETRPATTARFVQARVPFEQMASPVILQEIEESTVRTTKPEYRVYPLTQGQLLAEGMDASGPRPVFAGDKWGGKYLRAPDIYYVILEKGRDKLVRLGDIAEVRRGITTGANEFFYLDRETIEKWGIEEEFSTPFLFSLKEVDRYEVDADSLERQVFVCRQSKDVLKRQRKMGALAYIEWGEQVGFNQRPSVRGRRLWHSLPEQTPGHFVSNRFLGERFGFPRADGVLVCDVFFVGHFLGSQPDLSTALLNATVSYLSAEVLARKTYGIGVAYMYGPEINNVRVLPSDRLPQQCRQTALDSFARMRTRSMLKISAEVSEPDRRAADDVVFEALGLTTGEREAVYEALVDMVETRLRKAESLSGSTATRT